MTFYAADLEETNMASRKRWGRALVLVGVAAWIPYGVLKYGAGEDVAIYPFLTVHLLGVIPGFLLHRWGLIRRAGVRLSSAFGKREV